MKTKFQLDFRISEQKNPRGYSAVPSACIQTDIAGRTQRAGPGKRLFGFRNREFPAIPVEEEAYTLSVVSNEIEMNFSPPPQMEVPANKVISAERRYRPPSFKKLGLADVLRLLESNRSSRDTAVREPIEEFRLLLETGISTESNVYLQGPSRVP